MALEAWAAAHGKPAYDCLAWRHVDKLKRITGRSGAVQQSFLLLGSSVTVESNKRYLCIRRKYGKPFTVFDMFAIESAARCGTTVIWCRKWSDGAAKPSLWVPAMLVRPGCGMVTHIGRRRWYLEQAVMRDDDNYDWEVAEVVPEGCIAADITAAMLPDGLPDAGAMPKTTTAAMTKAAVDPHSVQFAALAWLVAAGQAVPARAIAGQIMDADYIVIWKKPVPAMKTNARSVEFAVARPDTNAFVRVFASIGGDFSHGGVVSQWAACEDGVSAAGVADISAEHGRHMLTIYSNRSCDETQGVWCKDEPKLLRSATAAAMEWAFNNHPRGEEFAFCNTEEDLPPGSDDSDDDDDSDA